MKKSNILQSIKAKIIFTIALILLFALELIGANFITQVEQQLVNNFQTDRQTQVEYLKTSLRPLLEMVDNPEEQAETSPQESINNLLTEFSGSNITELKVTDPDFVVLGISDNVLQSQIGQISNDPQVRQSILSNQTVTSQIIDSGTGNRHYKISDPVRSQVDGSIIGVITMESNIESVYQQVEEISIVFIQASVIAVVLSSILAYFIAGAITRPIEEVERETKRIASGDYTGHLVAYSDDELGQLAMSINALSNDVAEAQESIDSERRRLDSVLTHMSEGVLATDTKGNIIIVNSTAESMLDITSEQVMGKSIFTILDVDAENIIDLAENHNSIHVEGTTIEGETTLRATFSLIQSTGSNRKNLIQGLVCVIHDITEQVRIEEDRKQFVSNVSHELRTPLTSMRSYVEALNDGAWKDPELAPRFLEVTQSETNRMIRMIQDLLQLSRIDQGRSRLNVEIVDINELFRRVLERFDMLVKSAEYGDKNYVIVQNLLDSPVFTEIDPDRIIQVLDNLMNNAIKYSPDGGKVTGSIRTSRNKVIISVTDEGLGIPDKDLEKVFSRFYRVDKARSRSMGGSGLGLAISREVVEQHNGRIWVTSKENVGSTFNVSLPYVEFTEEDEWE